MATIATSSQPTSATIQLNSRCYDLDSGHIFKSLFIRKQYPRRYLFAGQLFSPFVHIDIRLRIFHSLLNKTLKLPCRLREEMLDTFMNIFDPERQNAILQITAIFHDLFTKIQPVINFQFQSIYS
jgi:hypothetical protein